MIIDNMNFISRSEYYEKMERNSNGDKILYTVGPYELYFWSREDFERVKPLNRSFQKSSLISVVIRESFNRPSVINIDETIKNDYKYIYDTCRATDC